MAAWIKILIGMEVGLGPSGFVSDGDQLPTKEGAEPPIFGPYVLWQNGWMDQDASLATEVGLGPGDTVLDGDPAPRPQKGA